MSSLLIDVCTSPYSLRGVLEVALGGKFAFSFLRKQKPVFVCFRVTLGLLCYFPCSYLR